MEAPSSGVMTFVVASSWSSPASYGRRFLDGEPALLLEVLRQLGVETLERGGRIHPPFRAPDPADAPSELAEDVLPQPVPVPSRG